MATAANQTDLGLFHGWMPTPNGWGTTDLLWSCLSTIVLCVWTAVHLPVPFYRGKDCKTSEGWQKSLRNSIVRSRFVPALIGVIAPEFIVLTASYEFLDARNATQKMLHRTNNMDIHLIHGYFLIMGGFCLRSPGGMYHQLDGQNLDLALLATESEDYPTEHSIRKLRHTEEWIPEIEKFSSDQIDALSKSDSLTKVIVCFQALWFITQVITRLHEHQAVTLLEVSTSAYVFCAFIAYVCWWNKPQGCSMPLIVNCSDEAIAELGECVYAPVEGGCGEFVWGGSPWLPFYSDALSSIWAMSLFIIFPLCFGAIHVASWNITLPSELELWMWRASTVFCTATPLYFVGLLLVMVVLESLFFENKFHNAEGIVTYTTLFIYAVVRLYMIVEVFVSMRVLPRSAYDSVTWSSAVPHI